MAHSQDAADALTEEVKDLVKHLQDRNFDLESKVNSLSDYIAELHQQMSDMQNREYDVWITPTSRIPRHSWLYLIRKWILH